MSSDSESQTPPLSDLFQRELLRQDQIAPVSGTIAVGIGLFAVTALSRITGDQTFVGLVLGAGVAVGLAMATAQTNGLSTVGAMLTVGSVLLGVLYVLQQFVQTTIFGGITSIGTVLFGLGVIALYLRSMSDGRLFETTGLFGAATATIGVIFSIAMIARAQTEFLRQLLVDVTLVPMGIEMAREFIVTPGTDATPILTAVSWVVLVVYATIALQAITMVPGGAQNIAKLPLIADDSRSELLKLAAIVSALGVVMGAGYLATDWVLGEPGIVPLVDALGVRRLLFWTGTFGLAVVIVAPLVRHGLRWVLNPTIPSGRHAVAGTAPPLGLAVVVPTRINAEVIDRSPNTAAEILQELTISIGETMTAVYVMMVLLLIGTVVMAVLSLGARLRIIARQTPGLRVAVVGIVFVAIGAGGHHESAWIAMAGVLAAVLLWELGSYAHTISSELGSKVQTGEIEIMYTVATIGVGIVIAGIALAVGALSQSMSAQPQLIVIAVILAAIATVGLSVSLYQSLQPSQG